MSEDEEELSEGEIRENHCGLILGCWDHEKTAALVQDLEHSVNLVERKCIQLFEELLCYKKYLEESGKEDFHLAVCKNKARKSKNSNFFSGSEPDIAFRKNLINIQEIQQVFEEKFKAKLCSINKELREAARKIGLKDNIILSRTGDHLRTEIADEAKRCYSDVGENFVTFLSAKSKSDPIIIEHAEEAEFSKITKNELEIYQKLSRLSMKRRKKMKKLKGRKMKFRFIRKSPGCRRQDFRRSLAESKKSKFRKNKSRGRKTKTAVPPRSRSHSPRDSFSQEKLNELEVEELCKSLNGTFGRKNLRKSSDASKGQEAAVEGYQNLGTVIRKVVPFTACTSTSRSHNIGLNMQHLLSLSKHGRSLASEKRWADIRTQNPEFGEVTRSNKIIPNNVGKEQDILCIPDSKNNGSERPTACETNCLGQKGGVWIPECGKTSNFRKVRSRYTGSSPQGVLQYHKSTMRQFTNGRKSMIKSELKTAYAVGSNIMVSDCQRTDVFRITRGDASGDGACNAGRAKPGPEWTKLYDSFLSMCRKYSSLKEKLITDRLAPFDDEELKSLEKEIDCSIEKYKDFLQFYSKFLQLNHRLKSLKIACESSAFEPVTSFSSNVSRKLCSCRPTHSTTMKKALREVQTLQEKIRLVNA